MLDNNILSLYTSPDNQVGLAPKEKCFIFSMSDVDETMLTNFFSSALTSMNIKCFSAKRIPSISTNFKESHIDDSNCLATFDKRSVFFGFRYAPVSMIKNKRLFINNKAILLIRDPRDCVIDAYLNSLTFLAPQNPPLEPHEEHYATLANNYCLSEIKCFTDRLSAYAHFLHPNIKLFRYEDIILNKEKFFLDSLQFLNLEVSDQAFQKALDKASIKSKATELHTPAVEPGIHTNFLSKQTLDEINQKHGTLLNMFGYT